MSVYDALFNAVTENKPDFAKPHTKEPEQQFLKRMLDHIADLSDAQFEALPEDAQNWFNFAVSEELNKRKEVTPPEGFAEAKMADEGPKKISRPVILNREQLQAQQPPQPEPEPEREPVSPQPTPQPTPQPELVAAAPQPTAAAPQWAQQPQNGQEPPRKRRGRPPKNATPQTVARPEPRRPFAGSHGARKEFSVRTLRQLVIENPTITTDMLMAKANESGEVFARTTVNAARNQTLEMIDVAKQMGHWR